MCVDVRSGDEACPFSSFAQVCECQPGFYQDNGRCEQLKDAGEKCSGLGQCVCVWGGGGGGGGNVYMCMGVSVCGCVCVCVCVRVCACDYVCV